MRIDGEVSRRATVLLELNEHTSQRIDESVDASCSLGESAKRLGVTGKRALERGRNGVFRLGARIAFRTQSEARAKAELDRVLLDDAHRETVKCPEARERE